MILFQSYLHGVLKKITKFELQILRSVRNILILMEPSSISHTQVPFVLFLNTLITIFLQDGDYSWTHVKEIPGTRLLVSVHHSFKTRAHLEVFDLSNKTKVKKVYSFEKILGGKFHNYNSA